MFQYSLRRSPWFFHTFTSIDKDDEKFVFQRRLPMCIRSFFQLVRDNQHLNPNCIVAPELGCLSAGELALLWIQQQDCVEHKRKARLKAALSEERKQELKRSYLYRYRTIHAERRRQRKQAQRAKQQEEHIMMCASSLAESHAPQHFPKQECEAVATQHEPMQ